MHKNIYFGMEKKRYETRGVQERIPLDYRYFKIAVTGKRTKSERIQKKTESFARKRKK